MEISSKKPVLLEDAVCFIALAGRAISQDEFSKCFEEKIARHSELQKNPVYLAGLVVRYAVLLPLRAALLTLSILLCLVLVTAGCVTNSSWLIGNALLLGCRLILLSVSVSVRHRGKKRAERKPHIYVANHTSFLDYIVLSSYKYAHSVVSQRHGGLFGLLFSYILKRNGSIQFDRRERTNRALVKSRIKKHITENRTSLLIFPEGTCVNNEFTVMFQKGAFDLGVPVFPVAIKYNKRLGDPYWNTRKQTFTTHFLYLITRWRTEVTVWWMKEECIREGEDAVDFANRVKEGISKTANLKNLVWSGYLKNCIEESDIEKLKKKGQEDYSQIFKIKEGDRSALHWPSKDKEIPIWLRNDNFIFAQNILLREMEKEPSTLMKETLNMKEHVVEASKKRPFRS